MFCASDSSQGGTPQPDNSARLLARGLPHREIVVLGHDPHVRWLVGATAERLQARVRSVDTLAKLREALRRARPDLVVVCGAPATAMAAPALSALRATAPPTAGMVVRFVHPCLAQVRVSDASGRPTSEKVVDFGNLAELPTRLLSGADPWGRVD